jgi:5-methylcytosine-specific restriction endonuclease McrA
VLAKPEPYRRVKARKKRQAHGLRKACREAVYARERMICQRCGIKARHPAESFWEGDPFMAHVNEIVPRSKGGDPLDPDNCELVHQMCHMPNGMHAPTAERQAILEGRAKGKA